MPVRSAMAASRGGRLGRPDREHGPAVSDLGIVVDPGPPEQRNHVAGRIGSRVCHDQSPLSRLNGFLGAPLIMSAMIRSTSSGLLLIRSGSGTGGGGAGADDGWPRSWARPNFRGGGSGSPQWRGGRGTAGTADGDGVVAMNASAVADDRRARGLARRARAAAHISPNAIPCHALTVFGAAGSCRSAIGDCPFGQTFRPGWPMPAELPRTARSVCHGCGASSDRALDGAARCPPIASCRDLFQPSPRACIRPRCILRGVFVGHLAGLSRRSNLPLGIVASWRGAVDGATARATVTCTTSRTVPYRSLEVLRCGNLLQTIAWVNPLPGGPWRGHERGFGRSRGVSITAPVRRMGHFPADAALLVGTG